MRAMEGLKRYMRLRAICKKHGLSTKGKMPELEARLREADIILLEELTAEATRIMEEGGKTDVRGYEMVLQAGLASAALETIAHAARDLEVVNAEVYIPPDTRQRIASYDEEGWRLRRRAEKEIQHGQKLIAAFQKLVEVARELEKLNVILPDALAELLPITRCYQFEVRGSYHYDFALNASSFDEVKKRVMAGEADEGKNPVGLHCGGEKRIALKALEAFERGDRQYRYGGMTITLIIEGEPKPERLYEFALKGPVYEGRCVVRATSLEEAKAKVLASDIVEGDRWADREMCEAQEHEFLICFGHLSEDRRVVSTNGHTLSWVTT